MEKNKCNEFNHKYGLWQIKNDKETERTCINCGHTKTYPMTSEVLKEIKKQQEAKLLLTSFYNLENNNINLIGYINVILENVINYITPEEKIILTTKLKNITSDSRLTEENKIFLSTITTLIEKNNQDELNYMIEIFQKYNKEKINTLSQEPTHSKK